MNSNRHKHLPNQKDIENVWRVAWRKERGVSISKQFSRLFTEGYKVYRKYLPREQFTLLELGAGSGRYGVAIARDNPGAHITITDPLSESVTLIQTAVDELHLSNVSVDAQDSLALTFPDNSFDVVFADVVIQHIIDRDKALQEMKRVLKPGGTLILSVVNTNNPFHSIYKKLLNIVGREYSYGYERTYTPKELSSLFTEHGLMSVQQDGFFVAYGMYRWGYTYTFFKVCARLINRCITVVERYTGRSFSRKLGFIILCIGTKSWEY